MRQRSSSELTLSLPAKLSSSVQLRLTLVLHFRFKDTVKIVHFIGAQKPWYYTFNTETQAVIGPSGVYESEYLVQWWSLFMKFIYPKLDEEIVSP